MIASSDSSPRLIQLDAVEGASTSPSLLLVFDQVRTSTPDHFGILSGWQWDSLRSRILRAGLTPEKVQLCLLSDLSDDHLTLTGQSGNGVIVGFGEEVLRRLTGKRSIDKWQLSPLETTGGRKFIPTYGLDRLQKQYELGLFVEFALRRAAEELASVRYTRTAERFLLNPPLEETLSVLDMLKTKEELACDVETGYGQINTVGFAWSESDAIAINVLPDRFGDASYYELWRRIGVLLESDTCGKIFQNFIYDTSYFSAYGFRVRNITHDTMHGMKVLWPELKSNLGNVGRVYTKRPYWKDDGKVTDEEGRKKDWGNVRDWPRHYTYNCRDTTGTFEGAVSQRLDLKGRGLLAFYDEYLIKLTGPVREMCAVGMPLSLEVRGKLKGETEARIEGLTKTFHQAVGSDLSSRSPKQVLGYLKAQGVKVPKVYDKTKGVYRESTDAASIKKIRLKSDLPGLKELQEIKTLDKALSSYINFDVRPDGRLSYSLNITGTETLRFSGNKDAWDRGFNIQTIPREGGEVSIKQMFVAPEGFTFIEADLSQAETRYVAYASSCLKLIEMLESGADVHKHVAYAILRALGLPASDYSKDWRNLGKKTGHGANYLMKEGTFVENVFNDMDKVLSKREGKLILDAYFGEFPEIRRWHGEIKRELYYKRKLTAPSGWERYFYGRPGDDMLREAVAWAPQHMIPWVTNKMMLHLCEERSADRLKFQLIAQVHDALYLLVPDAEVRAVALECLKVEKWHPEINLPGGKLVIPVEIEVATCLANKRGLHE